MYYNFKSRHWALVAGAAVGLLGLVVLVGWECGASWLLRHSGVWTSMNPNAALGLAALSAGGKSGRWPGMVGAGLGAVVLGLSAVALVEHVFDWELGLDQGLCRLSPGMAEGAHPGRVSPVSTFNFALAGFALLLGAWPGRVRERLSMVQAAGLVVLVTGGMALAGHFSEAGLGFLLWTCSGMGAQASAGFVVLGVGLLALARARGGLRWALDRLTTSGFVMGMVSMLAAAGVSQYYTSHLERDAKRVAQTQEELKEIEQMETDVAELESGRRGYIITGDEGLLAPRAKLKEEVGRDLADFRRLTAENAAQQGRLDVLEPLIAERSEFGEQTITTRRQEGGAAAAKLEMTGRGTALSVRIHDLFEELEAEETAALARWRGLAESSSAKTFLLLPLGLVFSLCTLAVGLFVLNLGMARRREAEAEAERLATVVRSSGEAIIGVDAAGVVTSWNAGAERLFLYSAEAMLGCHISRLIPEGRANDGQHILETLRRGGLVTNYETVRRRQDGVLVNVSLTISPIKDAAGVTVGASSVAHDITERKRADERIREQAALLDNARDAIMVHDLDGRVRYWNQGAERIFGWKAEEVVGHDVRPLLYTSGCEAACGTNGKGSGSCPYDTALRAVLATGGWMCERKKPTKAGGSVLIQSHWTLLRGDDGAPRAILIINTDITEKKALEESFLRAQRLEGLGSLAGGIAHDLNNVLAPIIMGVDLLKTNTATPADQGLLAMMETSGRRGVDMVKQVLLFARGVEGRRTLIPLDRLIEDFDRMARTAFPRAITIETSVPEGTWSVPGDLTQLHQVLMNLCVNARDAMPHGGTLRISARNQLIDAQFAAMRPGARPGPHVVLEVADTGEGMPPEVAARIFDPFFTTKEAGKGTGLGLATCHTIVNSHGGFITVESAPGKGTTFQVTFPAEPAPAESQAAAPAQELPRGNGELILIIDDEAAVRAITAQTLEACGYRVLSAGDGAEGVAQYALHTRDVAAVITDMDMPVLDGAAAIHAIQRINPAARIILASGSSTGGTARMANDGLLHYLTKPYTAEALLLALHELLGK